MTFRVKSFTDKLETWRNNGDTDRLPRETSLDSIASVIFPWRAIPRRRRPTLVAGNEAGREVDPAGFFLCMASVMLLSTGTGICAATLWVIVYTIPLFYLADDTVPLGTNIFSLCAGILSIPCCWIAWTSHNTTKNYTFLPLLMVLLGFCITMLATSASLGLIYKARISFNMKSSPPKLLLSRYENLLNETMFHSLSIYDSNNNHHWAWDNVQQRLKCCGVTAVTNWLNIRKEIPPSCCPALICKEDVRYTGGCLDRIAFDLMWQASMISGLSIILIAVQMFTLCVVSYMYIKGRRQIQSSSVCINISNSEQSQ